MSALLSTARSDDAVNELLGYAAAATLLATYFFSPLLAYAGTLCALVLLTEYLTDGARKAIGFLTVLSASTIWASRSIGVTTADDAVRRYGDYLLINEGGIGAILSSLQGGGELQDVGMAFEIVLPMLYLAFATFLPKLTASGLMLVLCLLIGSLFLVFIERHALREFGREKKGYAVAIMLLFFSFLSATQLTRQVLASVLLANIIAYAFSKPRGLLLLIATLTHFSSPIVYFLWKALQYRYVVLACCALSMTLWGTAEIWLGEINALVQAHDELSRVGYYFADVDAEVNISGLRIIAFVAIFGLLHLLFNLREKFSHFAASSEGTVLLALIGVIAIYVLTIDLVLLPFRLFLLIHAVAAGWFIALFTRKLTAADLKVIGVAMLIWRVPKVLQEDGTEPFRLWVEYSPFGWEPGYFIGLFTTGS